MIQKNGHCCPFFIFHFSSLDAMDWGNKLLRTFFRHGNNVRPISRGSNAAGGGRGLEAMRLAERLTCRLPASGQA
jgi:hypothetical protein